MGLPALDRLGAAARPSKGRRREKEVKMCQILLFLDKAFNFLQKRIEKLDLKYGDRPSEEMRSLMGEDGHEFWGDAFMLYYLTDLSGCNTFIPSRKVHVK